MKFQIQNPPTPVSLSYYLYTDFMARNSRLKRAEVIPIYWILPSLKVLVTSLTYYRSDSNIYRVLLILQLVQSHIRCILFIKKPQRPDTLFGKFASVDMIVLLNVRIILLYRLTWYLFQSGVYSARAEDHTKAFSCTVRTDSPANYTYTQSRVLEVKCKLDTASWYENMGQIIPIATYIPFSCHWCIYCTTYVLIHSELFLCFPVVPPLTHVIIWSMW